MDQAVDVRRVTGPGSMSVDVTLRLDTLRSRLGEAGHPLASVPQWNGGRFYLVSAVGMLETEDPDLAREVNPEIHALLIAAHSIERAREVAENVLRRRNGPTWTINVEEVELETGRQAQHNMRIDL